MVCTDNHFIGVIFKQLAKSFYKIRVQRGIIIQGTDVFVWICSPCREILFVCLGIFLGPKYFEPIIDHFIASNGTLFNMKFHPTALAGTQGLENFVSLVRGYFDRKGTHMQFNVVSRETLRDAQAHPEKYKGLVVRVAGYSALFTTLSRALQDDIINRTEQGEF